MRTQHYLLTFLLLSVLSLVFTSCGRDDDNDPSNPGPGNPVIDLAAARGDFAENVANHIIIPGYEAVVPLSANLVTAVDAFSQSPSEENLLTAQTALKTLWLAWQDVAIFQFGPAESLTLRNALNTYPVDDEKVENNINESDYILGSLDNKDAVGLPAIDYLLNGLAETNAEIVAIYASAEASNRTTYLKELTAAIDTKLKAALEGWIASGGNYIAEFTADDALGTDVGSSLGIIVNAIDQHFQRFTRDGKIAIPAGVRSAGVPRPTATEAFYGGYSVELLIASLRAYERLYMGIGADDTDRTGLYDYLEMLDAKELADDIQAQFKSTIDQALTLNDPLSKEIEINLDKVLDVFLQMQTLVPLLKSDMASLMGISITNQDNDGD